MLAVCALQPPVVQDSRKLKESSVSLSGQVSITLQIPVGISEVLSPSQLFQNLAAFPGLITSLIFSPHYFMGCFYFTEGQMGVFLPFVSVSLQCSVFLEGGSVLSTLQRQSSSLLLSILFTLVTFLCIVHVFTSPLKM